MSVLDNKLCTHCGSNSHFKKSYKAKFQAIYKNVKFVEIRKIVKSGSSLKNARLRGWAKRNEIHPFIQRKRSKPIWVPKSNL